MNVLLYIKKLFHLESMYSLKDKEMEPSNKEALSQYKDNFMDFVKVAKDCVQKSQDNKYSNPSGSLLKFS